MTDNPRPSFKRIVFNPAGLWENLLVFFLVGGQEGALAGKDHEASAGCTLVDRADEFCHVFLLWAFSLEWCQTSEWEYSNI